MKKVAMSVRRLVSVFLVFSMVCVWCFQWNVDVFASPEEMLEQGDTKIHFISLNQYTDAILLESNGEFAMIDSGEDWDCITPQNATPEYPYRDGITDGFGYEQQVIHYLESQGVSSLKFYLATHSHSDHIGSCDEILNHFQVESLYIKEYHENHESNAVWDNKKVYDDAIRAAEKNNTQIVYVNQLEEGTEFTLGDMNLKLFNTQIASNTGSNENSNSICVLIRAYGRTAYLSGDLYHTNEKNLPITVAQEVLDVLYPPTGGDDGDEDDNGGEIPDMPPEETGPDSDESDEIMDDQNKPNVLSEEVQDENLGENQDEDLDESQDESLQEETDELSEEEQTEDDEFVEAAEAAEAQALIDSAESAAVLAGDDTISSLEEEYEEDEEVLDNAAEVPDLESFDNVISENEAQNISITNFHKIDLYKMAHHGLTENNPVKMLEMLNPAIAVFTGPLRSPSEYGWDSCTSDLYYTRGDSSSVLAEFTSDGINVSYTKLNAEVSSIDGKSYYFDSNGRTLTLGKDGAGKRLEKGFITEGGNTYYITKKGELCTGWIEDNGKKYYLSDEESSYGVMQRSAWIYNDELKKYCFVDKNGVLQADRENGVWKSDRNGYWYSFQDGTYPKNGWKLIEDNWYYFDTKGYTKTGWFKEKNKWYFLDKGNKGAMVTGWLKSGGKWYHLDGNKGGAMSVGWLKSGGKWYYLDGNKGGAMAVGWLKTGGKWYYLDGNKGGAMVNGWLKTDNKWYYLNSAQGGAMSVGWLKSGGKWYYLDEKKGGAMSTGWLQLGGKWYYLDGNKGGAMATGWLKSGVKWYYLDSAKGGAMYTGWLKNSGKWYYLDGKKGGAMSTGWLKLNKKWYFLDGNKGGAMATGWIKSGGNQYYLNGSKGGAAENGWLKIENTWYYFQPDRDGAMAVGWKKISGKTYYFYEDGKMASDTIVGNKKIDKNGVAKL